MANRSFLMFQGTTEKVAGAMYGVFILAGLVPECRVHTELEGYFILTFK
jgi:hypothetical protein